MEKKKEKSTANVQKKELFVEMEERLEALKRLETEKIKALKHVPEGTLRVATVKNTFQYYHRTDPYDSNGKYISKKKENFIKSLAQKDYDGKILRSVKEERTALERYLKVAEKTDYGRVFDSLHEGRKPFVNPVELPEEEYVRAWEKEEYTKMGFMDNTTVYSTIKGERVRSKVEVNIANSLYKNGVPYRYEYPLYLDGYGEARPDFYCLNVRLRKEIPWEHYGMMDDFAYANKNIAKLSKYEMNGFFPGDNMILTMETSKCPLDARIIELTIERYLL